MCKRAANHHTDLIMIDKFIGLRGPFETDSTETEEAGKNPPRKIYDDIEVNECSHKIYDHLN